MIKRTAILAVLFPAWILAQAAESMPPSADLLLRSALKPPETGYVGRMTVTHWTENDTRSEELGVHYSPPNRYRWEFYAPDGSVSRVVVSDGLQENLLLTQLGKVFTGDVIKSGSKQMAPEKEWDLLMENYQLSGPATDTVVGRTAWVLTLIPKSPGKPREDIWVDQETHTILEIKRYRPNEKYAITSRFTKFDPSRKPDASVFDTSTAPGKRSDHAITPDFLSLEDFEKATGQALKMPEKLPHGFVFESADFFRVDGKTVNHLRYTDGLSILSLFQTTHPVRLPRQMSQVLHWKSGPSHYTLMGDLSHPLMQQISSALK